jgi:curved DNA-binding protein CbpA
MKSYYELLGVSANDDAEALKKAFRKAVKAHHPDLHPNDPDAVERFSEILAANSLLRDAKRRATYDWLLQLERECFQLKLKRPRHHPMKRMRTVAVIAAVSALIAGYGLWATMPTSGNMEIDKDELAAAAGADVVAENEHRAAPRPEIVAADLRAETVGSSLSDGPRDRASASTAPTDIATAFANDGLASNLETMVAAPGTNYDRTQPIVDAAAVLDLPLAPTGTLPAMKPQSIPTPAAPAVKQRPASLSTLMAPSSAQTSLDTLPARAASQQPTIDALSAISAGDVGSDAAVVVGGLAPGSTMSAGAPAGPTTLALPKSQRLGAAEIALMMEKGAALIGIGNVGGARLMFQHAAEAGNPVAAFALAETYDPLALRVSGVRGGITSDIALAVSWYEKAKDLGSTVAPERLKNLSGLPE